MVFVNRYVCVIEKSEWIRVEERDFSASGYSFNKLRNKKYFFLIYTRKTYSISISRFL